MSYVCDLSIACCICTPDPTDTEDESPPKQPFAVLSCKHEFCAKCIAMWVRTRRYTCPVCRTRMEYSFLQKIKKY